MSYLEELEEIVVEQLGLSGPEELSEDKNFVEDLNADSLDLTELVMTVEERFNIEVPQAEAEKLATFGDLIAFIRQQREKQGLDDGALTASKEAKS